MASGPAPRHGLFDELRGLFGSLFDLAGRRFELLTLEAQEEKDRLLDLVFRAALIIVLSWMALVCATATLVVAFWDQHPVTVLVVVTLAYGGAAALLALSLRRRLRQASRPFAGTLEELRKDRECFGTKN